MQTWKYVAVAALTSACGNKKDRAKHDDTRPIDAAVAQKLADAAIDGPHKVVRPEHAVWSAVENRHVAHRDVAGELVIDATNIGFARYTRFGVPVQHWHIGGAVQSERASLADRTASIDVPLIPEQATPSQLTLRVNAEAGQALDLRINGKKPTSAKSTRISLDAG